MSSTLSRKCGSGRFANGDCDSWSRLWGGAEERDLQVAKTTSYSESRGRIDTRTQVTAG